MSDQPTDEGGDDSPPSFTLGTYEGGLVFDHPAAVRPGVIVSADPDNPRHIRVLVRPGFSVTIEPEAAE